MKTLFTSLPLDTLLTETPARPPFNIQPLVDHFGKDATWMAVFRSDDRELYKIPGLGREKINALRAFVSENFQYSFNDLIQ